MHNPDTRSLPARHQSLEEFAAAFAPRWFVFQFAHESRHFPGDTTTPPAPGAIQIGPLDVP